MGSDTEVEEGEKNEMRWPSFVSSRFDQRTAHFPQQRLRITSDLRSTLSCHISVTCHSNVEPRSPRSLSHSAQSGNWEQQTPIHPRQSQKGCIILYVFSRATRIPLGPSSTPCSEPSVILPICSCYMTIINYRRQ